MHGNLEQVQIKGYPGYHLPSHEKIPFPGIADFLLRIFGDPESPIPIPGDFSIKPKMKSPHPKSPGWG